MFKTTTMALPSCRTTARLSGMIPTGEASKSMAITPRAITRFWRIMRYRACISAPEASVTGSRGACTVAEDSLQDLRQWALF